MHKLNWWLPARQLCWPKCRFVTDFTHFWQITYIWISSLLLNFLKVKNNVFVICDLNSIGYKHFPSSMRSWFDMHVKFRCVFQTSFSRQNVSGHIKGRVWGGQYLTPLFNGHVSITVVLTDKISERFVSYTFDFTLLNTWSDARFCANSSTICDSIRTSLEIVWWSTFRFMVLNYSRSENVA